MKTSILLIASSIAAASAFSPSADSVGARRDFLKTVGTAGVAGVAGVAFPGVSSAEIVVPPQVTEYDFPTDWGLTFKYEEDAQKVKDHMVIGTGLGKGAVKMEDFGKNPKKLRTIWLSGQVLERE